MYDVRELFSNIIQNLVIKIAVPVTKGGRRGRERGKRLPCSFVILVPRAFSFHFCHGHRSACNAGRLQ